MKANLVLLTYGEAFLVLDILDIIGYFDYYKKIRAVAHLLRQPADPAGKYNGSPITL